jgi:hypothetical protein
MDRRHPDDWVDCTFMAVVWLGRLVWPGWGFPFCGFTNQGVFSVTLVMVLFSVRVFDWPRCQARTSGGVRSHVVDDVSVLVLVGMFDLPRWWVRTDGMVGCCAIVSVPVWVGWFVELVTCTLMIQFVACEVWVWYEVLWCTECNSFCNGAVCTARIGIGNDGGCKQRTARTLQNWGLKLEMVVEPRGTWDQYMPHRVGGGGGSSQGLPKILEANFN